MPTYVFKIDGRTVRLKSDKDLSMDEIRSAAQTVLKQYLSKQEPLPAKSVVASVYPTQGATIGPSTIPEPGEEPGIANTIQRIGSIPRVLVAEAIRKFGHFMGGKKEPQDKKLDQMPINQRIWKETAMPTAKIVNPRQYELDQLRYPHKSFFGKGIHHAGTIGTDILTDPLTYLTFGANIVGLKAIPKLLKTAESLYAAGKTAEAAKAIRQASNIQKALTGVDLAQFVPFIAQAPEVIRNAKQDPAQAAVLLPLMGLAGLGLRSQLRATGNTVQVQKKLNKELKEELEKAQQLKNWQKLGQTVTPKSAQQKVKPGAVLDPKTLKESDKTPLSNIANVAQQLRLQEELDSLKKTPFSLYSLEEMLAPKKGAASKSQQTTTQASKPGGQQQTPAPTPTPTSAPKRIRESLQKEKVPSEIEKLISSLYRPDLRLKPKRIPIPEDLQDKNLFKIDFDPPKNQDVTTPKSKSETRVDLLGDLSKIDFNPGLSEDFARLLFARLQGEEPMPGYLQQQEATERFKSIVDDAVTSRPGQLLSDYLQRQEEKDKQKTIEWLKNIFDKPITSKPDASTGRAPAPKKTKTQPAPAQAAQEAQPAPAQPVPAPTQPAPAQPAQAQSAPIQAAPAQAAPAQPAQPVPAPAKRRRVQSAAPQAPPVQPVQPAPQAPPVPPIEPIPQPAASAPAKQRRTKTTQQAAPPVQPVQPVQPVPAQAVQPIPQPVAPAPAKRRSVQPVQQPVQPIQPVRPVQPVPATPVQAKRQRTKKAQVTNATQQPETQELPVPSVPEQPVQPAPAQPVPPAQAKRQRTRKAQAAEAAAPVPEADQPIKKKENLAEPENKSLTRLPTQPEKPERPIAQETKRPKEKPTPGISDDELEQLLRIEIPNASIPGRTGKVVEHIPFTQVLDNLSEKHANQLGKFTPKDLQETLIDEGYKRYSNLASKLPENEKYFNPRPWLDEMLDYVQEKWGNEKIKHFGKEMTPRDFFDLVLSRPIYKRVSDMYTTDMKGRGPVPGVLGAGEGNKYVGGNINWVRNAPETSTQVVAAQLENSPRVQERNDAAKEAAREEVVQIRREVEDASKALREAKAKQEPSEAIARMEEKLFEKLENLSEKAAKSGAQLQAFAREIDEDLNERQQIVEMLFFPEKGLLRKDESGNIVQEIQTNPPKEEPPAQTVQPQPTSTAKTPATPTSRTSVAPTGRTSAAPTTGTSAAPTTRTTSPASPAASTGVAAKSPKTDTTGGTGGGTGGTGGGGRRGGGGRPPKPKAPKQPKQTRKQKLDATLRSVESQIVVQNRRFLPISHANLLQQVTDQFLLWAKDSIKNELLNAGKVKLKIPDVHSVVGQAQIDKMRDLGLHHLETLSIAYRNGLLDANSPHNKLGRPFEYRTIREAWRVAMMEDWNKIISDPNVVAEFAKQQRPNINRFLFDLKSDLGSKYIRSINADKLMKQIWSDMKPHANIISGVQDEIVNKVRQILITKMPADKRKVVSSELAKLNDYDPRYYEKLGIIIRKYTPSSLLGRAVEEANAFFTAVQTTLDFAATFLHGGFLGLPHPRLSVPAFINSLRAFRSTENAARIMAQIRRSKNYNAYIEAGLKLTDVNELTTLAENELFRSSIARKLPFVRDSENAFNAFVNTLSFGAMEQFARVVGIDDKQSLQKLAHFVNVANGKGTLLKINDQDVTSALRTLLYAPRFMASRFGLYAMLPDVLAGAAKGNAVDRLIARQYADYAASVATILALGKYAGADIETDPTSSDFLVMRYGNQRIDVTSGLAKVIVLGARVATSGTRKSLRTGETVSADNILERYMRSKASPLLGLGYDLTLGKGKNPIGEPLNKPFFADVPVLDLPYTNAAGNLLLPLSVSQFVEEAQKIGYEEAMINFMLNMMGIRAYSFDAQEKRPR